MLTRGPVSRNATTEIAEGHGDRVGSPETPPRTSVLSVFSVVTFFLGKTRLESMTYYALRNELRRDGKGREKSTAHHAPRGSENKP